MFGRATIRLALAHILVKFEAKVILVDTFTYFDADGTVLFVSRMHCFSHFGNLCVFYLVSLWSPYVIGQTIIFSSCDFFLFFFLA